MPDGRADGVGMVRATAATDCRRRSGDGCLPMGRPHGRAGVARRTDSDSQDAGRATESHVAGERPRSADDGGVLPALSTASRTRGTATCQCRLPADGLPKLHEGCGNRLRAACIPVACRHASPQSHGVLAHSAGDAGAVAAEERGMCGACGRHDDGIAGRIRIFPISVLFFRLPSEAEEKSRIRAGWDSNACVPVLRRPVSRLCLVTPQPCRTALGIPFGAAASRCASGVPLRPPLVPDSRGVAPDRSASSPRRAEGVLQTGSCRLLPHPRGICPDGRHGIRCGGLPTGHGGSPPWA